MKTPQLAFLLSFWALCSQAQVGIGTENPNPRSVLDLRSPGNNQGLLVPRVTTTQRTAPAFTSAMTAKENGLLVFDSDENKFYFWQVSQWQPLRTGLELTSGSGISIAGNTISAIPQDLQLTGSTLTITNNPAASPINLSAFTGTNTDDQAISYNGATGQLSITRLTEGPQSVTITSVGAAGGDLAGSYPNPVINTNAITGGKILDGTIATGDLADNSITSLKIVDGVVSSGDIQDGTIATVDIANSSVTNLKIAPGVNGEVLTTSAGVTTWAAPSTSGAAGGDLTGTYPNPTIANDAVTSAKILNGTVGNSDLANGSVNDVKVANIAPGKLLQSGASVNQILKWNGAAWAPGTDESGGGGVSGSGSTGQVAYWSGGSSITGNSNLFWDEKDNRLGIGVVPKANFHFDGSHAVAFTLAKDGAYPITPEDYVVFGASATTDILLPDADEVPGRILILRATDPGAITVRSLSGKDKIDGLDEIQIQDGDSGVYAITLISVGGTNWMSISKSRK